MKSTALFVLLLALLLLVGCASTDEPPAQTDPVSTSAPETDPSGSPIYTVRLSGIADGASKAVNTQIEYTLSSKATHKVDPTAPKTATIIVNGTTYEGTYRQTNLQAATGANRLAYDAGDATFSLTPDGVLTDFFDDRILLEESTPVSAEKLIEAARTFSRCTEGQAEIAETSYGSYQTYVVTLTRMLGDLPTTDVCKVYLRPDGAVYLFQGLSMYGQIPADAESPFHAPDVIASLQAKAKAIYADGVEVTGYTYAFTLLPDGTPALECRIAAKQGDLAADTWHIMTLR